ncbi:hypothetical protein VTI28DRAFT_1023 [Corynascus sepedonium]
MSSPSVLVGLTTGRASLLQTVQRLNHGSSTWTGAMQRTRSVTLVVPLPLVCGGTRTPRQYPYTSQSRSLHTTGCKSQQQRRRPRTFHLTHPQPPTVQAHSSSPSTSTATITTSESSSDLPLSEQLRTVMRLLTHPVVVCTATHPHSCTSGPAAPEDLVPDSVPRAMTMSSFTSLALHPTPLVSFNVAVPSRTHDAVAASRRFNIHVLADDTAGARVADWFAGGNAEGREVFDRLVEEGGVQVRWEGAVGGVLGGDGEKGNGVEMEPPVLQGDGVLYVLKCKLLDDEPARGLVRVRDHVIVIGQVLEILEGARTRRKEMETFGLLYADRQYRQLGDCITPRESKAGGL